MLAPYFVARLPRPPSIATSRRAGFLDVLAAVTAAALGCEAGSLSAVVAGSAAAAGSDGVVVGVSSTAMACHFTFASDENRP